MGQIFYACAYDTEKRMCCTVDADKFHANCYSYSGAVMAMHYLLRQKPHRIMWGGSYIKLDHDLKYFRRFEDLLGLSTYYHNFEAYENVEDKKIYDNIKFIEASSKIWENIDLGIEKLKEYFDWDDTLSVKYTGYLVNHTQRLAINLADYYERSKGISRSGLIKNGERIPESVDASYYDVNGRLKTSMTMAIDPLPVLTETGGGTAMALYGGITADTTENLSQGWRGDLLQIVDKLPDNYDIMECCFATLWQRAVYCHKIFGVNQNSLLLKDNSGSLFEAIELSLLGKRKNLSHIKVTADGDETILSFHDGNKEASFSFDSKK